MGDIIGDLKKEQAEKLKAVRDLIAECTAPIDRRAERDPTNTLQHRTNRLLAAILEKLHEPR